MEQVRKHERSRKLLGPAPVAFVAIAGFYLTLQAKGHAGFFLSVVLCLRYLTVRTFVSGSAKQSRDVAKVARLDQGSRTLDADLRIRLSEALRAAASALCRFGL